MKKIFFATTLFIAGSFISANAGSMGKNIMNGIRKQGRKERREQRRERWLHSVNGLTESRFYNDFPDAKNVTWAQGAFAEASFYDHNALETAYYDDDNELVGTTKNVDYALLPAKAKQYIIKKYPGYAIQKLILFD